MTGSLPASRLASFDGRMVELSQSLQHEIDRPSDDALTLFAFAATAQSPGTPDVGAAAAAVREALSDATMRVDAEGGALLGWARASSHNAEVFGWRVAAALEAHGPWHLGVAAVRRSIAAAHFMAAARRSLERARVANQTLVVHQATVLFAGHLRAFRLAPQGVLSRLDIHLQNCEIEQVEERLASLCPDVLVMDLFAPRLLQDRLGAQRGGCAPAVVLVTPRGPDPQYEARASRIAGAKLVMGPPRLVPRIVEQVTSALGLKHRVHLRKDAHLPVQAHAGSRTIEGAVVNLSESGAKLFLDDEVQVGDALRLELKLGPHDARPNAAVVRRAKVSFGWEVGVQFEQLGPEDRAAVLRFVGAEPPTQPVKKGPPAEVEEPVRHHERVVPRLKLKARLRPPGGRDTHYLKVIDVSEGGFLAHGQGAFLPSFDLGAHFEVLLFGPQVSLNCTAEVVRTELAGGRLAMRFLALSRSARSELAKALFRGPSTSA